MHDCRHNRHNRPPTADGKTEGVLADNRNFFRNFADTTDRRHPRRTAVARRPDDRRPQNRRQTTTTKNRKRNQTTTTK
ncbi:hypothetical protein [Prevotella corporis]|nr:hypothetical protein [Prevotella corporis]